MKKPQLNKEEGQSLIQDWRASGKTITEYSKEAQIPSHRVHYWKRVLETSEPKPSEGKFIPIKIGTDKRSELEIQTPGGYIIRLSGSYSLTEVIQILS